MNKSGCYIGLMSGTSLDGLDIAAVRFSPRFELVAATTVDLPTKLRSDLMALCAPGDDEITRMGAADVEFGRFCAEQVVHFIAQHALTDVQAIGSHGQTIRHLPEIGFTLQIGDPNIIAETTNLPVIADFRRRDMAAGGQGAPLVPAFHKALFGQDGRAKVLANIGGIANITLIPSDAEAAINGYDTGPGNTLLDSWIQEKRDEAYDKHGEWAASGQVIPKLLTAMLSDSYFSTPAPKSTGREKFNLPWLQHHLNSLNFSPNAQDVQASLLALTAQSLSQEINASAMRGKPVFLCGGGARNTALVAQLDQLIEGDVSTSHDLGLDPDYVEAAAFGWLAYCAAHQIPANAPDVTGARGLRTLGGIYGN